MKVELLLEVSKLEIGFWGRLFDFGKQQAHSIQNTLYLNGKLVPETKELVRDMKRTYQNHFNHVSAVMGISDINIEKFTLRFTDVDLALVLFDLRSFIDGIKQGAADERDIPHLRIAETTLTSLERRCVAFKEEVEALIRKYKTDILSMKQLAASAC